MTKTIWKYPLRLDDSQVVQMPSGARILTVQVQDGKITLWAEVDPSQPKHPRTILIRGTGHEFEPRSSVTGREERYVGTVQWMGGQLIWHVFEVATS